MEHLQLGRGRRAGPQRKRHGHVGPGRHGVPGLRGRPDGARHLGLPRHAHRVEVVPVQARGRAHEGDPVQNVAPRGEPRGAALRGHGGAAGRRHVHRQPGLPPNAVGQRARWRGQRRRRLLHLDQPRPRQNLLRARARRPRRVPALHRPDRQRRGGLRFRGRQHLRRQRDAHCGAEGLERHARARQPSRHGDRPGCERRRAVPQGPRAGRGQLVAGDHRRPRRGPARVLVRHRGEPARRLPPDKQHQRRGHRRRRRSHAHVQPG